MTTENIVIAHNIGTLNNPNYNTREEILKSKGTLTFDGIYKNIWENRDILREIIHIQKRRVILFIMGCYVGSNNKFDWTMPYEPLADWNQLIDLAHLGCELAWHTWTHADLTTVDLTTLQRELKPPFPMEYFAYPYGKFNEQVVQCVRNAGFKDAFSVSQGTGEEYQRLRRFIK
jgi:hypothetical protein